METTVNQRIEEIFNHYHLSYNAASKLLGISQPTIGRQIKGTYQVSIELINAVLNAFPEVSAEWLMRGTGNMIASNEPQKPTIATEDTSLMRRMLDNLLGTCEEQRRMIERLNQLKLSNE